MGGKDGGTSLGEGMRCSVQALLERGAEPRVWRLTGYWYGGAVPLGHGALDGEHSGVWVPYHMVAQHLGASPHHAFSSGAGPPAPNLLAGAARRSLPGPRRSHTSTVGMPLASPSTSTCFTH